MLDFVGRPFACCDGLSRRHLLRVGGLAMAGLSLPDLLRRRAAASAAGIPAKSTSVIFIELAGGPTHFETYDPKPKAPAEFRGPLGTVATSLPGVYFSELMVEQARIADRLAIIRSVTHDSSSHGTSAHLTQTGYYLRNPGDRDNDNPAAGAVTARLRGANAPGVPAYVSVSRPMRFGGAAYLGPSYAAFNAQGDPNHPRFSVGNLTLHKRVSLDRLDDRRHLLTALDSQRRLADSQGVAQSLDDFSREAFDMVTSDRARRAFDIQAEDPRVRERYGRSTPGQSMLLARRLVEAGVSFVTVQVGGWDDHGAIERGMRRKGPAYDRGVAALVADLYDRGLDRDVLVVSIGEFGRTPRVNNNAGRDHWGRVMSALLAGGGMNMGQVIGSSTSKGEAPHEQPVRPESILATVYRHLGIDTAETFLDLSGRPRYVLERREEVVGL
jgi:hypothetical protein